MGGIETKEIYCRDFKTALDIDQEFEEVIYMGLIPETKEMVYYSWYWWFMYIWNINSQEYILMLEKIIDCGISGSIEGTKYGTVQYYENTWYPIRNHMQVKIFDVLDVWWHPAFVIVFTFFPPILG